MLPCFCQQQQIRQILPENHPQYVTRFTEHGTLSCYWFCHTEPASVEVECVQRGLWRNNSSNTLVVLPPHQTNCLLVWRLRNRPDTSARYDAVWRGNIPQGPAVSTLYVTMLFSSPPIGRGRSVAKYTSKSLVTGLTSARSDVSADSGGRISTQHAGSEEKQQRSQIVPFGH